MQAKKNEQVPWIIFPFKSLRLFRAAAGAALCVVLRLVKFHSKTLELLAGVQVYTLKYLIALCYEQNSFYLRFF